MLRALSGSVTCIESLRGKHAYHGITTLATAPHLPGHGFNNKLVKVTMWVTVAHLSVSVHPAMFYLKIFKGHGLHIGTNIWTFGLYDQTHCFVVLFIRSL